MLKNKFLILICFLFVATVVLSAQLKRDPFLPATQIITAIKQPTLQSIWIPLYFSKATDVNAFLSSKNNDILSSQGSIRVDHHNNQLWIQDDSTHIKNIRAMIAHLDKSGPQFLIKAKIINVDKQYQKKLGILFQTEHDSTNALTPLSLDGPNISENAGEFTVSIAKLAGNHLLDMQISALEQEGHATLISSPALMTLNNQAAVIQSGAEVPYQHSTSSGATSVSFKKAVLRLQVTPLAMPDHHILLHIALNQDKVSALTVNGVPAIETQQITTQVVVKNQQTIVLGGILETTHAHQIAGIPFADDIPVLGKLFQHQITHTKQEELLIFITPSMMKTLG